MTEKRRVIPEDQALLVGGWFAPGEGLLALAPDFDDIGFRLA
jgi:hypothetical protein